MKTELENLAQRALTECRTKRWRNVNCKSWARIREDGLFAVLQNQSHGREGGSRDQSEGRLPELEMDSRNAGQCPQCHADGLVKL